MENIFYMSSLTAIGGTESFFYYIAKKYKTKDITFVIRNGDTRQIERLMKFARVIVWNGRDKLYCKRLFCNYFTDIIDYCEADEYIQIIHTDYKEQRKNLGMIFKPDKRITKYLGVSKIVCEHFTEETGLECELCYNPIVVEKPRKVLNLISATRLTNEKGKDRMVEFGKLLDQANIPYLWTIFTNDSNRIANPNIIYMKPKLDITDYIANADYLVQLSNNGEGYGYTIAESLLVGTPVICTPCEAFIEIGVVNKKNSFILPFDMKNIDIEEIYNSKLEFEYKEPKDNWNKLLGTKRSVYGKDKDKEVYVIVREDIGHYSDSFLNREVYRSEGKFLVNKYRAEQLINFGVCELV